MTAQVVKDVFATYTPGVSERRGGVSTFLHSGIKNYDAQSNVSQVVSATREYDAFGNLASSSGTFSGPFGYGGPHGYQESAFHPYKLLGHRYYDPTTGRFLTRDKAKDGRNWYAYCDNNPLTWTDPEGNRALFVGLGGQMVIGVWSISAEIDFVWADDGVGISASIGGGPAMGAYAGGGINVSYDDEFLLRDPDILV